MPVLFDQKGTISPSLQVGKGVDENIQLTAQNADANKPGIRYNASTNVWEATDDGTNWYAIRGVSDHGGLTGLADDDHTQYVLRDQWHQNGIEDRADSTLSFTDGTRTFSIQPTGANFGFFEAGIRYTSTGDTKQITDVEGVHIVYYDADTITEVANPTHSQIEHIILEHTILAYIYWDATNKVATFFGGERHMTSMSPVTHLYLHETEGLRYIWGLGLNNLLTDQTGDLNSHAQFGVDEGEVADEDRHKNPAAIASTTGLPIFYLTGAGLWRKTTNSGFAVKTYDGTNATRLMWNRYSGGSWGLQEVSNLNFVLCHVFMTTGWDYQIIACVGQNEYATVSQARAGALVEVQTLVTNTTLTPEIRPLATLIFQTSLGYGNDVNARIRTTEEGDDYIDWRNEAITRMTVSTKDHGSLTGLADDDHTQYLTEARHTALAGDHVTNGDSHDHSGGDGAQIDHTTLSNIGSLSHSTIDSYLDQAVKQASTPTFAGMTLNSLTKTRWPMAVSDYTGNGVYDKAAYRYYPSGEGYFLFPELITLPGIVGAFSSYQWGGKSLGDVPLFIDLDGDDIPNLAVYRHVDNNLYWIDNTGVVHVDIFGSSGDFLPGVPRTLWHQNGVTAVYNYAGGVHIGGTSTVAEKALVVDGTIAIGGGNIDGTLGDVLYYSNATYPTYKHRITASISSNTSYNIIQHNICTGEATDTPFQTVYGHGYVVFSPAFYVNVGNNKLGLYDPSLDHLLRFVVGSELTADRELTITTGDASRTLTLSGNPTLADWFDQAVKTTSSPTFETVGVHDTDDSHHMVIKCGSDLAADRDLTFTTGDAARTITLSGNPTLNDWFDQSVKTTATPQFTRAGIGIAASTNAILYGYKDDYASTGGDQYGGIFLARYYTANAGTKQGLRGDAIASNTSGSFDALYGIYTRCQGWGNGGSVVEAVGLKVDMVTTAGHSFTTSYGIYVTTPLVTGTMGTTYGLYLGNATGGSINWSIYSDGGNSYHGGKLSIGTTTIGAKLSIDGGVHVGGTADPGDNNLTVDGLTTTGTLNVNAFTVTVNGACTLNDWFDQSVKTTAAPTFTTLTTLQANTGPYLRLYNYNAGVDITAADTLLGVLGGYGLMAGAARLPAAIAFYTDGTCALNDYPGRISFLTVNDGAISTTEKMRITNAGLVNIMTDAALGLLESGGTYYLRLKNDSGLTADKTLTFNTGNADRTLTINGNATLNDWFDQSVKQAATPTFGGATLSATSGPTLLLQRTASPGSGDVLGYVKFGYNGFAGAAIYGVGDAAWGTSDYPGRLSFYTTPDAGSVLAERMRINNAGRLIVDPSAVSSFTDGLTSGAGAETWPFQIKGNPSAPTWVGMLISSGGAPGRITFAYADTSVAAPALSDAGDTLGVIEFMGYDGADYNVSASIEVEHDVTTGSNDMSGRIRFLTTADGATATTEALRINSKQNVSIGGVDATYTTAGSAAIPNFYIYCDRDVSGRTPIGVLTNATTASSGSTIALLRKKNTGAVASGDRLGTIAFYGNDGTDYALAASIWCDVATTPGSGDMPGALYLGTSADGTETPTGRWIVGYNGDLGPNGNKTYNIGSTANRVNVIYYSTATTGTSRVVETKAKCKICNATMVRGTGSMVILGETEDYELCFCPDCGMVGVEKQRHNDDDATLKANKTLPPKVVFKGFRVLANGGLSRKIFLDFHYGDVTIEERGDLGPTEVLPLHNSTMLGEVEFDNLMAMTPAERQEFIYNLGLREWYALEEVRLMQDKVRQENVAMHDVLSEFLWQDLHEIYKDDPKYKDVK